jgi:hypothetical protein
MTSHVTFEFQIDSGNAAVVESPRDEVCRLLGEAQSRIRKGYDRGTLMDANGNSVGHWFLIESPDEDDEDQDDEYNTPTEDEHDEIDEDSHLDDE